MRQFSDCVFKRGECRSVVWILLPALQHHLVTKQKWPTSTALCFGIFSLYDVRSPLQLIDPDGIAIYTWATFCTWHRSQGIFGDRVEDYRKGQKRIKIQGLWMIDSEIWKKASIPASLYPPRYPCWSLFAISRPLIPGYGEPPMNNAIKQEIVRDYVDEGPNW